MTIDERLQALAETVEIIAGMQEKNERSIEALAVMQVQTFEMVKATNESMNQTLQTMTANVNKSLQTMAANVNKSIQTMAENVDKSIQNMADAVKHMDRNMEVLIQYAHRHEDWLEELEKRRGTQ